jgi:predicted porin
MRAHQLPSVLIALSIFSAAMAEDVAVPRNLDASTSAWQFSFSGLDDDFTSRDFSSRSAYSLALGDAPRVTALNPAVREPSAAAGESSLTLRTPSLNGLFGHLAVVGEDAGRPIDEKSLELGATYDMGGLFLGAGYRYQADRLGDSWGVGGGYSLGNLQLSAAYRRSENPDIFGSADELRPYAGALGLPASIALDSGDGQVIDLGFQYRFGRSRARLGYSRLDGSASAGGRALDLELDRWVVGIDHGLSRDVDVFAEYQYNNRTSNDQPSTDDAFGLGLRHRF